MKATELINLLHFLINNGMREDFKTQKVYFDTTLRKEFSNVFGEDKQVKEGIYLWIWTEDYKSLKESMEMYLGADFHPFHLEKIGFFYHIIIHISNN